MDYAFPCVHDIQPEKPGGRSISVEQGMTLRDWFAGKALTFMAAPHAVPDHEEIADVATVAYLYADAMLKARQA